MRITMRAYEDFFVSLRAIMEVFDFKAARQYAMSLGLTVACTWIVSFLMFASLFPSLGAQLAYLLGLASIPLVGIRLRRYRQQEPTMTIGKCWWVSWFTFMCCVLLTTAAQYAYLAWIDGGRLCNNVVNMLHSPEVVNAYEAAKATDILESFQRAAAELQGMSVKDFTMGLMSTNMILGLIFSLISLLFLMGSQAGSHRVNSKTFE